jgi:Holliday junction DNA helicase RuvA
MIGKLIGLIDEISDGILLLNVNGVCYKINISQRDANYLSSFNVSEKILITIEHIIREDAQLLYGFLDKNDHTWFLELTKISGVGPKFAMSILSVLNQDELYHAIVSENANTISRANGIGSKLASRVVNEIKPRLGKIAFNGSFSPSVDIVSTMKNEGKLIINDAILALTGMGFTKNAITSHIKNSINENPDISTEELIRDVLKKM